jgi:phosphoserine/homoserine phosphotransferase
VQPEDFAIHNLRVEDVLAFLESPDGCHSCAAKLASRNSRPQGQTCVISFHYQNQSVSYKADARHYEGVLKNFAPVKQSIVTLDMEGVLTPEIWIAVAEKTGIPELRRTTRDEPDYDKLMNYRISIMDKHGIKLSDIQNVIGTLDALPGGKEFLDELRRITQVLILSDTFEQFAQPLMKKLNWPALFCHRLIVENDRITGYKLRIADQKKKTVAALKALNYHVISAGDSYNDTGMLLEANAGFLIHAPENVKREFPQLKAVESHAELLKLIKGALAG